MRKKEHQLTFKKHRHFSICTTICSFTVFVSVGSLSSLQMQTRILQCCERKEMLKNNPNYLMTGKTSDEILVNHFDPRTKSVINVLKHTDSLFLTVFRQTKLAGNVIMTFLFIIIFFYINVYQHGASPKSTTNLQISVLKLLRKHTKRTLWTGKELDITSRQCSSAYHYFFLGIC